MAVSSLDAKWGTDDCVSFVMGDDFKRPKCIQTETQEEAYIRAVKRYGGVDNMCAEFARRGAYRRVSDGSREVGDVVVGSTANDSFCIAKIDTDYLPVARTLYGYNAVEFLDIVGVWRKV